jgi:hypothetical protein
MATRIRPIGLLILFGFDRAHTCLSPQFFVFLGIKCLLNFDSNIRAQLNFVISLQLAMEF